MTSVKMYRERGGREGERERGREREREKEKEREVRKGPSSCALVLHLLFFLVPKCYSFFETGVAL